MAALRSSNDTESPLVDTVDRARVKATAELDQDRRGELGQFLTPAPVARLMASMIRGGSEHVRILEPGAGVGSLVAAAVEALAGGGCPPKRISVRAVELDPGLAARIPGTFRYCEEVCRAAGIEFRGEVVEADFIEYAARSLDGDLFGGAQRSQYDLVIANPPYRKINTDSEHRRLLRQAGVEASNLYAGFMGLAVQLLAPGGEVVAITPRSYCNGTYFRPFRELLLRTVAFQHIYVFESRREAFKDDAVLQENIVWRAVRDARPGKVTITAGNGTPETVLSERTIHYRQLVWPRDRQRYIHIVPDAESQAITDTMRNLPCALHELDVEVSTGRVVDFRARDHLRKDPEPGAAPLIYPAHFSAGFVKWPVRSRKANALALDDTTRDQIVPNEVYVLLKRFSSKEERRRVVAVVYDPARLPGDPGDHEGVGFENHLNYVHRRGRGVPLELAMGLAVFFNSTLVDQFFRQFSGHTQVNAGDLRMLRYPTEEQLSALGSQVGDVLPDQEATDALVEAVLPGEGALQLT